MTRGAGCVQSANRFRCVTQAGGYRVASVTIPSPATGAPVTSVPGAGVGPRRSRHRGGSAAIRVRYGCGRCRRDPRAKASAARLCRSARRTGDGTRPTTAAVVAVFRSRLAAPEIHFYSNPTYLAITGARAALTCLECGACTDWTRYVAKDRPICLFRNRLGCGFQASQSV